MKPRRIALHIDQLVLHGVPAAHRQHVGEALRQELSRLLSEGGLPAGLATGGAVPRLEAGNIAVTPGAAPRAMGSQIAQAIYSGLGRGR
jgi:hypothetical protein